MQLIEPEELSIADRLKLIQDLWESILRDSDNIPSPDWHKDVLAARLKKIDNGDTDFVSVDTLIRK